MIDEDDLPIEAIPDTTATLEETLGPAPSAPLLLTAVRAAFTSPDHADLRNSRTVSVLLARLDVLGDDAIPLGRALAIKAVTGAGPLQEREACVVEYDRLRARLNAGDDQEVRGLLLVTKN